MTTLFIRHVRDSGYCARGARDWCKRHNINFTQFLQHGIDCDEIEKIGDHFALTVCKRARDEEQQSQGAGNGQG